MRLVLPALMAFAILPYFSQTHAQTVYSESGASAADITGTVDEFRDALGDLNPFTPEDFASGRRQINWDAAPDAVSAPNSFAGDFFNFGASPRARGIEFSTEGSGFQLSATEASGEGIYFSNINTQYEQIFDAFSPERLFTAIDSNVTDVSFFTPSDQVTAATVNGFGVIFSDIDLDFTTSIELFDATDNSLGLFFAKNFTDPNLDNANQHFSFLGVSFADSVIGRARITTGTDALGGLENLEDGVDLVVMDDIIFGEPQAISAVPEPGSAAIVLFGIFAVSGIRRRG